jgi:transcription elongation GreA/GreB family factor
LSRAFVKEVDADDAPLELPDRPISPHPNFVTTRGLELIDAHIADLRSALATAQASADKPAVAAASRDLRYWTARRSSAELVPPADGDEVRFGSTVTIERDDGRQQRFRITGEDEADPAQGTLSYVSPLARALIGRRVSDEIDLNGETIVLLRLEHEPS